MYGLRHFGGNFTATQSTIDTILTSLATSDYRNYFIAEVLGVPNKRVAKATSRRAEFDKFVQSQIDSLPEVGNNINQLVQDDSESTNTIASSTDSKTSSVDESNWQDSDDVGDIPSEPQLCNTDKPSQIKRKKNAFNENLNYKKRKERRDKLNLEVVREFCHDVCRLDTFNSSKKIQVHNYNGTFEYHTVHIKNQSLKEYYQLFEKSTLYSRWQNENIIYKNGKIPVIKYRSFTNAFCPCCLNQKQRDCANHEQVSLMNALKALGNLRRSSAVSSAIKTCSCEGHKNEDYLRCHTSLKSFISAVSCPELSENEKIASINIKE